MYDDYHGMGFTVLAVNLNEDMEGVVKPRARQHAFSVLRDAGSVWSQYRQNGSIPLNYVIDGTGIVRHWMEGFDESGIRNVIVQYLNLEHDVGVVRLLAPNGIRDSGTQVTPLCSLFNSGRNVENYPVRMRIGADYDEVVQIAGHQPGTTIGVPFPTWTALLRGISAVKCTTGLVGDLVEGNNTLATQVTVQVFDVATLALLAPVESIDSGATVTPRAVVANLGTGIQRFYVKLRIGDLYADSVRPSLASGAVDTVEFRAWTADRLGEFPVNCSAAAPRDLAPLNDRLLGTVRVVHCAAIAESPNPVLHSTVWCEPAVFRTATRIHYEVRAPAPVVLSVYSSSGQLVRTVRVAPAPGPQSINWDGRDNAGQTLPAGVYSVRLASSKTIGAVRVLKLD